MGVGVGVGEWFGSKGGALSRAALDCCLVHRVEGRRAKKMEMQS